MAERRRGLGRGLGALIPSGPSPEEVETVPAVEEVREVERPKPVADKKSGSDRATSSRSRARESEADEVPRVGEAGNDDVKASAKPPRSTASNNKKKTPKGNAASGSKPAAKPSKDAGVENKAVADPGKSSTKPRAKSGGAESGTSSSADVSRETERPRRRRVSAEARQKAMKARMDLGVSTKAASTTRPSDMFFTPTPSSDNAHDSAEADDAPEVGTETIGDGVTVSRETASTAHRDVESRGQSDSSEELRPSNPNEVESNGLEIAGDQAEVVERLHDDDESSAVVTEPQAALSEVDSAPGLQVVPGARFVEIDVEAIHPNRKQPRQVFDEDEMAELAYSIAELGVLQPVVVRPSREADAPPYELVMGERRWRATQRAGLEVIPAIVRETSDDDLLRDALLENLHRSQLNPLEEAAAYQQLLEEFGASQEELSRRIGRSRPQISNTLRLLRLPALVQRRVAAGVLSAGHARALLSLDDPAEMERLAQRIVAEGLSVRATEEAVTLVKSRKPVSRKSAVTQERHRERLDYIADAFSDKLDTSVKINLGAHKGRMTIEFASVEDLNRIISVLDPQGLPESQN